jgi:hypothetical protein
MKTERKVRSLGVRVVFHLKNNRDSVGIMFFYYLKCILIKLPRPFDFMNWI